MKHGAFDYIMKPADIDDLMDKMRKAFEKKSNHEEKIRQAKIKELKNSIEPHTWKDKGNPTHYGVLL